MGSNKEFFGTEPVAVAFTAILFAFQFKKAMRDIEKH